MADAFRATYIPVIFNAYAIATGRELVSLPSLPSMRGQVDGVPRLVTVSEIIRLCLGRQSSYFSYRRHYTPGRACGERSAFFP